MPKTLSMRARALQSRDAIELLSDKWRITILHVEQDEVKVLVPSMPRVAVRKN